MIQKIICRGRALRIAIGVLLITLLLANGAGADVHNINKGTNYSTIQAAINDASTGNEIRVDSGTYYENVIVNKQLILRGVDTGGGKPVVNALKNGSSIKLTAGGIWLEGFTITNASINYPIWNSAGIFVISNGNTLANNDVLNNNFGDSNEHGINLENSNNNILNNNNVSNNFQGIELYNSNYNTLIGNNVTNSSQYGIWIQESRDNLLINNSASDNPFGFQIYSWDSFSYKNQGYGNNTLRGNNASNNTHGIDVLHSINNTLEDNIVNSNLFGINMVNSEDNILRRNILYKNTKGVNLNSADNNELFSNYFLSNTLYGIEIYLSNNSAIYNNYFNNPNNFDNHSDSSSRNVWNTTYQANINIAGGPYLGGNFWANPNGTGFSQTCTDSDKDGICDAPYVLYPNNIDYLPLSPFAPPIPSEIHGMKFNDSNGNGLMDTGESGLSGIEIRLIRMIMPGVEYLVDNEFTNINGNYNFTGLPPGFYRVEELPWGFVQTFPANGMPHFIDLKEGEIKTGINFGNQKIPAGEISGINFNDSNANGVLDGGETGIPGISICLSPSWRCSTTDSSGNYSFSGVSPGNYTVYEYLSPGYVATTLTMVEIVVNSGEVKVVNFGSRLPVPPPEDITVEQQSGEQNGVPTVFRPALTVLTITKNLTNISENVVSVNLTMNWSDGTSRSASMIEMNNSNVWIANFNAPFPGGIAQMRFDVDVDPAGPGPEDAVQIGDIIFIDPSGVIKNAYNRSSISGATVTLLYEYPPGTNNFIVSPPENQVPVDNPLITDTDGRYSWLTIAGKYKVRAEKAGYIAAESVNVTVPPVVTDLNISLIPILPAVRFINGTVIDSLNKTGIAGVKVFTNTSNSTTNASGFYSLTVTSGTYNITATFLPAYYTNSTTVSATFSAVVVQDIEMVKKPTGNITGSVTGCCI